MIMKFFTFGLALVVLSCCQAVKGRDWEALIEKADSLVSEDNADSAITIGKLALEKAEKKYGAEDSVIAFILHRIGEYYLSTYFLHNYYEAESFMKRCLQIREKIHGEEHPDVAASLLMLAVLYMNHKYYTQAEPLFQRSLAIYEKILGTYHLKTMECLRFSGDFYYRQSKYAEAAKYFERTLAVGEKILGSDHPDIALCLIHLGQVYWYQGKYKKCESSFIRSAEIREKALGPHHPTLAISLRCLGATYKMLGRLKEAVPLYKRSLAIWENAYGPDHVDVAVALRDLGDLYILQGKYTQAEQFHKRALAINEKELGPFHPYLAWNLNSLGKIYIDLGMYAQAEKSLERALDIRERILGVDHMDVTSSLDILALAYGRQSKIDMAEDLYNRSLTIKEKALGSNHLAAASSLHNLGAICLEQGKLNQADTLFEKSLAIYRNLMGSDNPGVAYILEHQSQLHRYQGNYMEAMHLAKRAFNIRKKNFAANAVTLSEKDAVTYSQFIRSSMDNYFTCYFNVKDKNDKVTSSAINIALSGKGRISDELFKRQKILIEEKDSTVVALVDSLKIYKYQLSRLFVKGPGEDMAGYKKEIDSLNMLIDELEAELAMKGAGFRRQHTYEDAGADQISSFMPENSVLIEYIKYNHLHNPDSSSPGYLAIILTDENQPDIIDLGETSGIDSLVDLYRKHMLRVSGYGTLLEDDLREYQDISVRIYNRIWRPIEDYLTGNELVLIAPDGALNMISFAGLLDAEGRYLVEDYTIHYLSCGRDLIRFQETTIPADGLFAMGDPDYNAPAVAGLTDSLEFDGSANALVYCADGNVRMACRGFDGLLLNPLPSTRSEIQNILASWSKSTDEPALAYYGHDACERLFKALAPGNRVIHLATHGYFLGGECWPKLRDTRFHSNLNFAGENPLLLSGLFLAGANDHTWESDTLGIEDGILTAYEVSAMDLSGTELVVLSACETGLGKVEQGEGVYGLRRAFQMAGAKTVVSALWPVSDKWTAKLMSGLYDLNGKTLPQQFRNLQLDLIDELRDGNEIDHPVSWGAFIAQGDWR